MKTKFAAAAALLIATTVAGSAADLPLKAMLAPTPVWSWSGFYVGAHVGAGWGITESTLTRLSVVPPVIPPVNLNFPFSQNSRSGFLGGAQAGYNWQTGWIVLGVQADIAGMDVKGTTPCVVILSCTTKSDWLATATGRIGAVVADRGLIYVKGGGAWLNSTHTVNLPFLGGAGTQLTSKESTTWGWLVGMGVEYMIAKNWTAFIEYDYIEFDKKNEAFPLNLGAGGRGPPIAVTVNADILNKLSIAKVGANYKF
jgi:outer membrane immunogenic protein